MQNMNFLLVFLFVNFFVLFHFTQGHTCVGENSRRMFEKVPELNEIIKDKVILKATKDCVAYVYPANYEIKIVRETRAEIDKVEKYVYTIENTGFYYRDGMTYSELKYKQRYDVERDRLLARQKALVELEAIPFRRNTRLSREDPRMNYLKFSSAEEEAIFWENFYSKLYKR